MQHSSDNIRLTDQNACIWIGKLPEKTIAYGTENLGEKIQCSMIPENGRKQQSALPKQRRQNRLHANDDISRKDRSHTKSIALLPKTILR